MIALSTGSLYTYGTARAVALAAEAGYDGIEIMVEAPLDTRDARYLRRIAAQCGLPIVALHSPFVPDVPGWPADQMGRLARTLSLAQEVGVDLVVTHLPFRLYGVSIVAHWLGAPSRRAFLPLFGMRRDAYARLVGDAAQLAQLEAETGVRIAVENMPQQDFLGVSLPLYQYNDLDRLADLPHLTFDTTHIATWGLDLLDAWDKVRHRVAHVHLSNYDGREHRLPPEGQLQLDAFLRRLAHDGYGGAVSVECGPQVFEAHDEDACRANLARVLDYCRTHLEGAAGAA
ncbi:MAG: sugar phosphate isomerase/epimerase [Anaerolineae bacterium]|nr:sugar phosphate isomerase/epimerase [Anaerolineae bacterium]